MAGSSTSIPSSIRAIDPESIPIPGLRVDRLVAHADPRGCVTEIFRDSWGIEAMHQWTALTLERRVVRGPSVHRRHADVVIALSGGLQIGLRDLRDTSPVFRRPFQLSLSDREPMLAVIPPGVMHAFYAPGEPVLVLVGSTHEYDPDDDIKCRWQDAALDLDASVVGTDDSRARALDDVVAALRV